MGRIILLVSVTALIVFGILAAIPIVRHLVDPEYKAPTPAWVLAGTVVTGAVTLAGHYYRSRRSRRPRQHV